MGFDLLGTVYALPGILIGLSFHEFAHAWVAYFYGDNTAKDHGRLTVNPMAHLDPLGTLFIIFPPHFGWAKPVPVNPYNYRGNRKIADTMVSIAGPLMNLLLSFVFTIILMVLNNFNFANKDIVEGIFTYAIQINVILFVFNLIPVPPLDGSHILFNLLPAGKREIYFSIQKYGFVILIILLITGIAWRILAPIVQFILTVEFSIFIK